MAIAYAVIILNVNIISSIIYYLHIIFIYIYTVIYLYLIFYIPIPFLYDIDIHNIYIDISYTNILSDKTINICIDISYVMTCMYII